MDSGEGPVCPPVVLVAVDVSPAEVVELVSLVVLFVAPVVVPVDVTAEEFAVVTPAVVVVALVVPVVLGPAFVVALPTSAEPVVEEVEPVVAAVLPVVPLLVVLGSGVLLSPDEQLVASTSTKPNGWFENRFNERAFIVVKFFLRKPPGLRVTMRRIYPIGWADRAWRRVRHYWARRQLPSNILDSSLSAPSQRPELAFSSPRRALDDPM